MGLRNRSKAYIKDFNLPLLDEPVSPIMGQYSKPHTKVWAAKIGSFDCYVFVTPEYNHGISGALKNAIDFLFREWNDKAAGFVSYGGVGGARAVEQLRDTSRKGILRTLTPSI
jgi:NAD(P)H-dependent FMN reductase